MSLARDLENLEQRRDRELKLLRSRMTVIADMVEHEASPAQWVGRHPYVATAGAAMIGFIAAQLPSKSSHAHTPPPSAAPPPAPPPSAQTSNRADLLGLLLNLAEQFLQPPRKSPPSPPASLKTANAGSISDSTLRRPFSPTPECAQ